MDRQPDTHYAEGPEGNVAYQIVGDGPIDLVVAPGWFSHIDKQWEDPRWRTYIGELATFARVILYDKSGTGLSDPVDGEPTVESRADDLRAVMDAAGCEQAALYGISEGGPISVLFAATYPERVRVDPLRHGRRRTTRSLRRGNTAARVRRRRPNQGHGRSLG